MQINLDFSAPSIIPEEKKDTLISFRVGETFKAQLSDMAKVRGLSSLSDLVALYVIRKYSEDYERLLTLSHQETIPIRDLMAQR